MARHPRSAPGGLVYHVLNRSVGKMVMFRHERDFEAFERVLLEAHDCHPIPILSFCVMPTHWHFVVRPHDDGQVTAFFRWLAHTHAMRWRVSHHTVGYGHLYQGRFKCFPVQEDGHFLTVCRYVERNPLAAEKVKHAQEWRWSSLWTRLHGSEAMKSILSDWPVSRPANWTEIVNRPMTARELDAMQTSLARSRPLGGPRWVLNAAHRLGTQQTLRPEGRPPKPPRKN